MKRKIVLLAVAFVVIVALGFYMNASIVYPSGGGASLSGDVGDMLSKKIPADKNWEDDWFQYELQIEIGHLNEYCDRLCFEYQAELNTGGVRVMLYNNNLECVYDETFLGPCKVNISHDMDPNEPYGCRLLFKRGTTGYGLSTGCIEYVKRYRDLFNMVKRPREERDRLQGDFWERFNLQFDPYYGDVEYP